MKICSCISLIRNPVAAEEGYKINQSIYLENCSNIVSSDPWCYTKVNANLKQYEDKYNWGFCKDRVNTIYWVKRYPRHYFTQFHTV